MIGSSGETGKLKFSEKRIKKCDENLSQIQRRLYFLGNSYCPSPKRRGVKGCNVIFEVRLLNQKLISKISDLP